MTLSRFSLDNEITRDFIRRVKVTPITRKEKLKQLWAVQCFDSFAKLPKIKCPVLIMAGTNDFLIPYKNADILKQRMPEARLVKFTGLSHAFIGDNPEAVFDVMPNFLQSKD